MNPTNDHCYCSLTGQPFEVTPAEATLRKRVSPTIGGRVYEWPTPTLCPEERQRRRLLFRNERHLYRNRSAISGAPLISSYSPDKKLKVVSRDEWLQIDNTQFGRPFDFNKTFFEQFGPLLAETYKPNVIQDGEMLNSEFCHFAGWSKNCYLLFDSGKNEDCSYGALFLYSRSSMDCFYAVECELCYDCVKVHNSYALRHSQFSSNCSFSAYLTDCIGCTNCLCCANLHNKEYYAFNKPVGKAEFDRLWSEFCSGSFAKSQELAARYERFLKTVPRRALRNVSSVDATGDMLASCVSIIESYNLSNSKDCAHCHDCIEMEECLDVSMFGEGMIAGYELSACGGARGKAGVSNCACSCYVFYGGYNIFYSIGCHQNCRELFGCSELNRKEFCILNRQYSPSEYETLLPRIVEHMEKTGEWGQFFPPSLSPYGYNESVAQEFLPLTQDEARALGLNWSEYIPPAPAVAETVEASALPDAGSASLHSDAGIICARTGKLFRLTQQEREFYDRCGLPLPRLHPEERQRARSLRFNRRKLRAARCSKTGRAIVTTLSADVEAPVYSDEAYREEW